MTATDTAVDGETQSTMTREEWWGYAVWLFVGAAIAVPELWAAIGNPWWPTISATVGHLETLWSPVKIIVLALIAAGTAQVLSDSVRAQERHPKTGRRVRGTRQSAEIAWYFPAAVIVIVAVTAIVATLTAARFTTGYVLYGLIAVAFGILPNVLAYCFAREVPFPTLLRTLKSLDRRCHPVALVPIAGLSVLAVHLVAYPWP
jgi:hypothetical protein